MLKLIVCGVLQTWLYNGKIRNLHGLVNQSLLTENRILLFD